MIHCRQKIEYRLTESIRNTIYVLIWITDITLEWNKSNVSFKKIVLGTFE